MSSETKRHLRVLTPTMSNASLLLACPWPWGRIVSTQPLDQVKEHEAGFAHMPEQAVWSAPKIISETGNALSESPEANYGSAIHEVLAARIVSPPKKLKIVDVAAKWDIEDVNALKAHALEAVETFIKWASKKNPWGVNLTERASIRTEMSIAYNVEKNTARLAANPTADTHEYKGIEPGELPGTSDVVFDEIETNARLKDGVPDVIVIDHKTGDGWNMPLQNAQLKSLALANVVRIGAKTAAIGIFHTPVENVSTMYIDEIDRAEIKEFRGQLRDAWRRIGDGSLRPGPHCSQCPAISICPAQANAIVQVETSLAMTPERVGEIVLKLSNFMAAGERIEREIKAWIKSYGLPGSDGSRAVPRPDGKWYRTKPTKQAGWQISTKQLREVLGVDKAEEIIKALKAAGHLKDREYDDWRTVNDT
jgi:hypothetical protein